MSVLMTATSFLPAGFSMAPFCGAAFDCGGAPGAGVEVGDPCASASRTRRTAHATRLAARTPARCPRPPWSEKIVIVNPPQEIECPLVCSGAQDCSRSPGEPPPPGRPPARRRVSAPGAGMSRVLYCRVEERTRVPLYSHSRLSTYEKCPLQYRYRYLDKIRRDTQSIEAFLGNRVHEALERLYRELLASRTPSLDELLGLYHKTWDENFSDRITIVKSEFGPDHYRGIGVDCLTRFYRSQHPFDDGTTVGLEERVTLALDEKGRYQLQGYIDRLVRQDGGVIEIHDYKTSSGRPPSDSDLRKDRQLTIYCMAVAKRFPDAREIRLVWHHLVSGQTLTSDRRPEEIERQRRQMIGLIDTIEAAKEFPARRSALCGWCEYREIWPAFCAPG